jgi:uncharacterized protein (UPF0264 family)
VSVRDAGEAVAALAGAVIVDVKEPSRGPLGRPDASFVVEVLIALAGRAVVTLACGELADSPASVGRYVNDVLAQLPSNVSGPIAIKAGPSMLRHGDWQNHFQALQATMPQGIEAVAVAYADFGNASCLSPEEVLTSAAMVGARAVLIDTFDKSGPGLFERIDAEVIRQWVHQADANGLTLALAGKLTEADVVSAMRLGADVVGVRSAACDGGRLGRIDPARVRALGRLVAECLPASLPRTPGALIP